MALATTKQEALLESLSAACRRLCNSDKTDAGAAELLTRLSEFQNNPLGAHDDQNPIEYVLCYVESRFLGLDLSDPRCHRLTTLSTIASTTDEDLEQLFASIHRNGDHCRFPGLTQAPSDKEEAEIGPSVTEIELDHFSDKAHDPLYRNIQRLIECTCLPVAGVKRHIGHLELKPPINIDGDVASVAYDTIFGPCCKVDDDEPRWSLLRSEVAKLRKVRFTDHHDPNPNARSEKSQPHSGSEEFETLCSSLCHLFEEDPGPAYKHLRIDADTVTDTGEVAEADAELARAGSQTLFDFQREWRLSDAAKLYLAVDLCTSVWRFYASDWMKSRWTGNEIRFVSKLNYGGEVEFTIPSVVMNFDQGSDAKSIPAEEHLGRGPYLHRSPRILALAVMLVVIFGHEVEERGDTPSHRLNSEYKQCKSKVDPSERWPVFDTAASDLHEKLRLVLQACLQAEIFQKGRSAKLEDRRAYLLEKIVKPLLQVAAASGFSRDEISLWSRETEEPTDERTNEPCMAPSRVLDSQLPSTSMGLSSMRQNSSPEEWLERIRESKLVKDIEHRKIAKHERIKIAILDTGYDPSCAFFTKKKNLDRIAGYHDFVFTEYTSSDISELDGMTSVPCDDSAEGHGTFVLSLAMSIATQAEFYVARIAQDSLDESDAIGERIVKAIYWAVAKDVHILSMSWGFQEDHIRIQTAIEHIVTVERCHKILLFGAASNQGFNVKQPDFPARHPWVFAVHATDHFGNLADFDTRGTAAPDIATLGQNVKAQFSKKSLYYGDTNKTLSGTSFATPIAASVAALVLDATRLGDSDSDEFEYFRTDNGMKKVFESNSFTAVNNEEHRYLIPHKFMSSINSDRRAILRVLMSRF